ncbi:S8 family serine peptidase [Bogoriella caseilytica]|uniref:PA domain-containing protein n=1 Tax=Bogoriella caseilytica TaxID=56055 RepID=A0A3N2BBS2_9MICO|nr:S8 family serine peptidase [Bogoriella caseilytica]ROR72713.1 PA domain-containing protein [Bogoriella caseilytica]
MSSRRSTGARGGARALVAGLTGALVASALTATSAFAEPSGEIDSIVTAEAVAEDDGPAPVFQSEAAQRANTGLWVVQLEKPSAARYGGGEPGLAATSPQATGSERLDVDDAAVQRYTDHLSGEHAEFLTRAEEALGRRVQVEAQLTLVVNGLILQVSAEEAQRLAELEGVAAIYEDEVREVQTEVSNDLIGSPAVWQGDTGTGSVATGAGIVVGMLDTGVNPNHLSFQPETDEYDYPAPDQYFGACGGAPSQGNYDICNDKLIGAWNFYPEETDPRDFDSHGSHVGGTIAGAAHDGDVLVGTTVHELPGISGVAPHAQIISYRVCGGEDGRCLSTASVQAVQQAIEDGVDVLNYSISGSDNPWNDIVDQAFLDAYTAGMVVSASAGNDGPGAGTAAKSGPWNFSVGMTTTDRTITSSAALTDREEFSEMDFVPAEGLAPQETVVAPLLSALVESGDAWGCSPFDEGTFEDSVALIQRGECEFTQKFLNAEAAGAVAVVLYNNEPGPPIGAAQSGTLPEPGIPAVMISMANGLGIEELLAQDEELEITINTETVYEREPGTEDWLSAGSSRGPSQHDLLLPTFSAPGVNILAAASDPPEYSDDSYAVLTGTSMAAPHAAGAAALLRELRPEMSPAQIRSALSSTAVYDGVVNELGEQAHWHQIGAGRIDVEAASRVGLVLDETAEAFGAANPADGGDPRTLNMPSFVDQTCVFDCEFTRVVSNAADTTVTYDLAGDPAFGLDVSVTPAQVTLAPGESAEITVGVDVTGLAYDSWVYGNVLVTTGGTYAGGAAVAQGHFPVAVVPTEPAPEITLDPEQVELSAAPGAQVTEAVTVGNSGTLPLDWELVATGAGTDARPRSADSGYFSDYFSQFDAGVYAFDDFTLSSTGSISDILVEGFVNGGSLAQGAEALTWYIYPDEDGRPAGHPEDGQDAHVWTHTTSVDDPAISIPEFQSVSLDLVEATGADVALDAGTYWITFFPTVVGDEFWYWFQAAPSGNPAMIADPQNLLGEGAGWHEIGAIASLEGFAFTLEGEFGYDLPGDVEWLDISPVSGTVPTGDSQEMVLEIDTTGLEEGRYEAVVGIGSNDPHRPVAVLPVSLEVAIPPAEIELSPRQIVGAVPQGGTGSATLDISNPGGEDLLWEFVEPGPSAPIEEPRVLVPRAAEVDGSPAERATVPESSAESRSPTTVTAADSGIQDGGFEAGTPNPYWDEHSDAFGTVICSPGCLENDGPGPYAGSWWAWFGGVATGDAGFVAQDVVLEPEQSQLSFYLQILDAGVDSDWFAVLLNDEETVFEVTAAEAGDYAEYTEVTVDLSEYVDGEVHTVRFASVTESSTNFFLDEVALGAPDAEPTPPACDIQPEWLGLDPVSGVTAPGGTTAVEVSFDATELEPGTYTTVLCLASNATDGVIEVPVALLVEEGDLRAETTITWEVEAEEVEVGETIVIFGEVVPAAGRDAVLREILDLQPLSSSADVSDEELEAMGESGSFRFSVPAGTEVGERVFEVYVAENEEALAAVTEPIVVTVVEPGATQEPTDPEPTDPEPTDPAPTDPGQPGGDDSSAPGAPDPGRLSETGVQVALLVLGAMLLLLAGTAAVVSTRRRAGERPQA